MFWPKNLISNFDRKNCFADKTFLAEKLNFAVRREKFNFVVWQKKNLFYKNLDFVILTENSFSNFDRKIRFDEKTQFAVLSRKLNFWF